MKRFFVRLLSWTATLVLSFRYKITVQGFEEIGPQSLDPRFGTLFLGNHSAEMDPVILMKILGKKFKSIRPLVAENFFVGHVGKILHLVDALPVPNLDISGSRWKIKKMESLFEEIKKGLLKGENFLIYPAGRLKSEGKEMIGGASLVSRILEEAPTINIVLMRTTGLWGSSFSRALTGKTPDFGKVFLEGVKWVLKNALFFTPKRKILVQMSIAPKELPRKAAKLELNGWLESWFNQYPVEGKVLESEPMTFISYSRWREKLPVIAPKIKTKEKGKVTLSSEAQEEIILFISKLSGLKKEEITPEKDLTVDLGLDSLDLAEIHAFLSEKYDLPPLRPDQLHTVRDVFQAQKLEEEEVEGKKILNWFEIKKRKDPLPPYGQTLQEAFLRVVDRMGSSIAVGDRIGGAINYRQLKVKVFALAELIKRLEGDQVGILFPSSSAAYLLILATLFAKKLPVMLNWTTGSRALDAACETGNLKTILSSRAFLEKLSHLDLGKSEEKVLFLEDFKEKISLKDKCLALIKSHLPLSLVLKSFKAKGEDPAVLLFTTGSESTPKAVPLSHTNLLENHRAAFQCVDFRKEDIMLGFLPPFHSFGFSVTGIMPILMGLKVFYLPDPTASRLIARECREVKSTILCAAPSFYKGIFRAAKPGDLDAVRFFVSGAEKAPPELFEAVKKLGGHQTLLEGYGITECSPVVSINRLNTPARGVGIPLPGVKLCTVHPETRELLNSGETGEICIHGPSVFQGYWNEKKDPFLLIEGEKWYLSGDLGYLEDGALILSGRLKRFIKIGGEMISFLAIEEELIKAALTQKWLSKLPDEPVLSVGSTKGEKPYLVLFSTFDVSRDAANQALREAGFSVIVKISEVRVLEKIPLTGTGKTHYRLLESLLAENHDSKSL